MRDSLSGKRSIQKLNHEIVWQKKKIQNKNACWHIKKLIIINWIRECLPIIITWGFINFVFVQLEKITQLLQLDSWSRLLISPIFPSKMNRLKYSVCEDAIQALKSTHISGKPLFLHNYVMLLRETYSHAHYNIFDLLCDDRLDLW